VRQIKQRRYVMSLNLQMDVVDNSADRLQTAQRLFNSVQPRHHLGHSIVQSFCLVTRGRQLVPVFYEPELECIPARRNVVERTTQLCGDVARRAVCYSMFALLQQRLDPRIQTVVGLEHLLHITETTLAVKFTGANYGSLSA